MQRPPDSQHLLAAMKRMWSTVRAGSSRTRVSRQRRDRNLAVQE
jgi:hypothetical protein